MKKWMVLLVVIALMSFDVRANIQSDTLELEVQGTLANPDGSLIKIQIAEGVNYPQAGIEGVLSRYSEMEVFGAKLSGWVDIGRMLVVQANGGFLILKLLEELSIVTENGVKVDHFKAGSTVKFTWKIVTTPDDAAYRKGLAAESDDEAFSYFLQAIAFNPDHAEALNRVGVIYDIKGNLDSALYYFSRAYDINPKEVMYIRNICLTAYRLEKFQQAFEFSVKAMALRQDDAELWYLRSLTRFAKSEADIPQEDRASILSDIDKAIELSPQNSFFYAERSYFRQQFGNLEGACSDAKKARELGEGGLDDVILELCGQ